MARGLRIGYPRAYSVFGDAGSYAVSGQAAALNRGRTLVSDVGSYFLDGQAATLTATGSGGGGFVVPTITFTFGVASSHDLTQYVTGWNSSTMSLLVQGTALPTGITFNGTHLVYNGSGPVTSVSGVRLHVITDVEQSSPGGTPAYIAALSNFQIARLTSTSNGSVHLQDVVPSEWITNPPNGKAPRFITDAYSGGTGDGANGRLWVHGQGHSDGANNGLYMYEFGGTTIPTGWSRLSISAVSAVVADAETNSDGRPQAIHTFGGMTFDPTTNRVFRFGGSKFVLGSRAATNWAWDMDTLSWVNCGGSPGFTQVPYGAVASQLNRKVLVTEQNGAGHFYRIDTNTVGNTWSWAGFDSSAPGNGDGNPVMCLDTLRQRVIAQTVNGQMALFTPNWTSETVATSSPSVSGATSVISRTGISMFYDAASDRFWLLPLGSLQGTMTAIYSMHPTTFVITAHTTSGVTSGYNAAHDGTYNRIVWMPQWRALGFVMGVTDAAYVMKVPVI